MAFVRLSIIEAGLAEFEAFARSEGARESRGEERAAPQLRDATRIGQDVRSERTNLEGDGVAEGIPAPIFLDSVVPERCA